MNKVFRQPRAEVLGWWCGEGEFFASYWVVKRKLPRVEEESWCGERMFFSVDGIAQNGGADVLEVDADLMGAASVEVAKN